MALGRKGPGLPYKGVQVLLTTWTRCTVCKCVVEHLEQAGHDAWHERHDPPDLVTHFDDPALAS